MLLLLDKDYSNLYFQVKYHGNEIALNENVNNMQGSEYIRFQFYKNFNRIQCETLIIKRINYIFYMVALYYQLVSTV